MMYICYGLRSIINAIVVGCSYIYSQSLDNIERGVAYHTDSRLRKDWLIKNADSVVVD